MSTVFLTLLNTSIMASWTMVAVVVLRLVLRKAPKWTVCLLWAILAVRLVLPFSFESSFSLIPSAEVIPTNITQSQTPAIYSGIPQINSAVNPVLLQTTTREGALEDILTVLSVAWAAGVGLMLLYSVVSWLLLRLRVRASLRYQDNIYLCDHIQSPFVLGVLAPRIYIPSGLEEGALDHVLAHERAHIRRLDHLWKPLGYCLLSIHWFNPLLWIGYILLCRDIERACDEKVLARIGDAGKAGYANALLECSAHRRMILTCPVAFGEVGVAARVKNALRYKKPAFWVIAISLLLCCGAVMCFLTDPQACSHIYAVEVNAAATCTHKGLETHTCQICEHSYMAYTELCPHVPMETTVLEEPNCSYEGKASVVCADCSTIYLQTLPKAADVHEMIQTELVESTCAAPGLVTYKCAYCDHPQQQELPASEHQYELVRTYKPTCVSSGKYVFECTLCHDKVNEYLPRDNNAHSWSGYPGQTQLCSRCGIWIPVKGNGAAILEDLYKPKSPSTSQFPVIQWDIDQSVRPKP